MAPRAALALARSWKLTPLLVVKARRSDSRFLVENGHVERDGRPVPGVAHAGHAPETKLIPCPGRQEEFITLVGGVTVSQARLS